LRNAVSVASLILTTHTLIADRPDYVDPTAGPAMGGGAEFLGRA
jgi:chaperonin GroEL